MTYQLTLSNLINVNLNVTISYIEEIKNYHRYMLL